MGLASVLGIALLIGLVACDLWAHHQQRRALETFVTRVDEALTRHVVSLPNDLEEVVKHAFAKAGLNTNLAHDVLKHALDAADLGHLHTFADLREALTRGR